MRKPFLSKKFIAAAFTLSGSIIGAGILGLPYVFAQSGFLIGLSWVLFLGLIVTYTLLCLGEITLRTKRDRQLPGLTEKYLGKTGKYLMAFAAIFGIYAALIAYLIGEGSSLSILLTGSNTYAPQFVFGFWLLMTIALNEGLKGLKKVETYGVFVILALIIIISVYYSPSISIENLKTINTINLFLPFGVVLFALIGFPAIPEIRFLIKGSEKRLKQAILVGSIIPIITYIAFSLVFVGVLGTNVPQIATIGLGKLVIILGIFTMLTSYFVLSFALKDTLYLDLKLQKKKAFVLTTIIPIMAYMFLDKINQLNFVNVLGIGGVVAGGLMGILILLSHKKAKTLGNRKPEFQIPNNWFIIITLILIFIAGMILELIF
ncbi:hypothetical protein CMI42_05575 [Candidatus Pacearchaeota archaeon]|nr:hypothetical protein [Candidatus Pacearchaeota archaeon]